ncbi:hypothetical protein ACJJH9_00070 (plasmid) [Microbulbifer sp. DLAB2-AF]|uniref:hypothetical protein n=1 Tax=Microbulbifer sp. DLAB2-AF TaxID=3243395 RepID=UPI00403A1F73
MNGNDRQEFERAFPNPEGVQWNAEWGDYRPLVPGSGRQVMSAVFQNCRYQGWLAARQAKRKGRAVHAEPA